MKLLYILNVANQVNNFSYAAMLAAKELGIEFWIAGKWGYASAAQREADAEKYGIHIVQLDLDRSPYSMRNRVAYKQLCDLIRKEHIDAIHCNTPVGGMLGRLAGKKCKVKKVIYQAHGFHFYKGAPRKNWLVYYPIEKWLARYTDALITINHEDFELAKAKLKLRKKGKVYYVPGVGIDVSAYATEESVRSRKRAETGLSGTEIVLISMGDLIPRKNYDTAIRAIAAAENPALQYLICGKGPEEDNLKALAERLGVAGQIHFLGFRSDIKELLAAADIFLFTTRQEGLPRSMMEAMASGLPCVASRIRGNTDLLESTDGGFLCDADDAADFADKIKRLAADPALRAEMGAQNRMTLQKFSTAAAKDALEAIYKDSLRGGGKS